MEKAKKDELGANIHVVIQGFGNGLGSRASASQSVFMRLVKLIEHHMSLFAQVLMHEVLHCLDAMHRHSTAQNSHALVETRRGCGRPESPDCARS